MTLHLQAREGAGLENDSQPARQPALPEAFARVLVICQGSPAAEAGIKQDDLIARLEENLRFRRVRSVQRIVKCQCYFLKIFFHIPFLCLTHHPTMMVSSSTIVKLSLHFSSLSLHRKFNYEHGNNIFDSHLLFSLHNDAPTMPADQSTIVK